MKWTFSLIAVIAVLALLPGTIDAVAQPVGAVAGPAIPLGTAFTYQGLLKDAGGNPVTNHCDFQFGLYSDSNGVNPVGTLFPAANVPVTGGYFTVSLDFGPGAFDGTARWLQIGVRCPTGSGSFTTLTPLQPLTPAPYALALPGLMTQQNITSTNLIGGYSGNTVAPGKVGAAIGGGGYSLFPNHVTADYGTVSGGDANTAAALEATVGGGFGNTAEGINSTVGGGWGNVAGDWHSTVAGGLSNTASGNKSVIAGGHNNTASGFLSTIAGGYSNTASYDQTAIGGGAFNVASGNYATIPGGLDAAAAHYGELAYASGEFSAAGDAQTAFYVLRRQTTTATQTSLYLDGDTASQRLTIAPGRAVAFDILVVARSDSAVTAGYRIWGVIGNTSGTTTMIGASGLVLGADAGASGWDAVAAADDTNDALDIRVTGAASTNIHWVAVVHTVEVAW